MSRRAETLAERAVWPHEEIHPEQAGELADRMLQMDLNPAPILLVHHGAQGLREPHAGKMVILLPVAKLCARLKLRIAFHAAYSLLRRL